MKKINEANYTALRAVIEQNEKRLWDLYRKIGGSYKSRNEAWDDMIQLGKIAEAIATMSSTIKILTEE